MAVRDCRIVMAMSLGIYYRRTSGGTQTERSSLKSVEKCSAKERSPISARRSVDFAWMPCPLSSCVRPSRLIANEAWHALLWALKQDSTYAGSRVLVNCNCLMSRQHFRDLRARWPDEADLCIDGMIRFFLTSALHPCIRSC